jgi:hypothetical protein
MQQKYWNRAEKVASTKKKLHEHTKQASDSQYVARSFGLSLFSDGPWRHSIGKEATQLASVKASARKIIVQDRATGSVSGGMFTQGFFSHRLVVLSSHVVQPNLHRRHQMDR